MKTYSNFFTYLKDTTSLNELLFFAAFIAIGSFFVFTI